MSGWVHRTQGAGVAACKQHETLLRIIQKFCCLNAVCDRAFVTGLGVEKVGASAQPNGKPLQSQLELATNRRLIAFGQLQAVGHGEHRKIGLGYPEDQILLGFLVIRFCSRNSVACLLYGKTAGAVVEALVQ